MKKIILFYLIWASANSFAGPYYGSIAQGVADGQAQAAQTNALNAWANCINAGGGQSCGSAPQAAPAVPAYQPQPQKMPQYQCMALCLNGKPSSYYSQCQIQCR